MHCHAESILKLGRVLALLRITISIPNVHLNVRFEYTIRCSWIVFQLQIDTFNTIEVSKLLVERSLVGPTADYEDNLQLHSAVISECAFFLTQNHLLLKLGYFGETRILSPEEYANKKE